jgi:hypothetical protein
VTPHWFNRNSLESSFDILADIKMHAAAWEEKETGDQVKAIIKVKMKMTVLICLLSQLLALEC